MSSFLAYLWHSYINYLWNYVSNSWVATIAYAFHIWAILAILPTLILALLVSISPTQCSYLSFVQDVTSNIRTFEGSTHVHSVWGFNTCAFTFNAHTFTFNTCAFTFKAHTFTFNICTFTFNACAFVFNAHTFVFYARAFAFNTLFNTCANILDILIVVVHINRFVPSLFIFANIRVWFKIRKNLERTTY